MKLEQIEQISRENGITIERMKTMHGRYWPKKKLIKIPNIKGDVSYSIALHELGHLLGKRSGRRLDKEVQAWEWAIENAIEWTDAMNEHMKKCLRSYLSWCQRRRGAWIPPNEHRAWKMAGMEKV